MLTVDYRAVGGGGGRGGGLFGYLESDWPDIDQRFH